MNFDQLLALAILASIVVLGVVITVGNFSVMSAILHLERSMRRQKAMEREDRLRERLRAYAQTLTERLGKEEGWRGVALGMLARATGEARLGSEDDLQVVLASASPVPELVLVSRAQPAVEYVLTTRPQVLGKLRGWKRRLWREAIPLDAVLYPEARLEAYGLWATWVRRLDPQVEEATVMLQEEAPWWLVVVPREGKRPK